MNKEILKYLNKLYKHVEYYNKLGPFSYYGSEYEKDIELTINKMKDNKEDYDELPVVACRYCKSLHIITDEVDNTICMRCNSINELIEFENIHKYNKFINDKNT